MAKETSFNPELVKFLQSEAGSHVKVVYFNENGKWLFRAKGEFKNAVNASEITGQSVVEEIESEVELKPKKGKK